MKVALIDLNHMTLGVHTNTVPLGIGVIAKYLKQQVDDSVDVRMFKDSQKLMKATESWMPDVLGIAQYAWNSELNLFMARRLKKKNPLLLVVAGGPNLELKLEEKEEFLKKNPVIDICVSYDGEIPFATIVQRLIKGESIRDLCQTPVAGTYALDPDSRCLIESQERPPRLTSLDVLGAMYAEGFFDEFLNEGYHPFLQTQRGCPFRCTFCHAGDSYYSKMLLQSVENFREDMEYLGKRYLGDHNITLYFANTNFGLFDEDFAIAGIIRDVQEKYDWPKDISTDSGKDPEKLMKLLSILKYKFPPAIALQTATPKVLNNIKRVNIPFDKYIAFQKEVVRTLEISTASELILSLPDETKESFLETVSRVLNSGVQNVIIFTLMGLSGTELASRESSKKYGHLIRYRIVPRCFSEIDHEKIFDAEKVIVGTHSMPYMDYLDLRGLALIITIFASSIELLPLRRLLMSYGFDIAKWIFAIQHQVFKSSVLSEIYRMFLQETEDELFPTRKALTEFFSKPKNYAALCEGRFGDNLLRKYKAIALSQHYAECVDVAFAEAYRLIESQPSLNLPMPLLDDLRRFLMSRDVGSLFLKGCEQRSSSMVHLSYDIPRWLASSAELEKFDAYRGSFTYSIEVSDYMRNRLRDFLKMNRNVMLSLQILYRDGSIKEFWPVWVPKT